ncbi:hypothetical protein SCHPADRAFT_931888 [Schizopora paradoxa]|uniref:F-box domain-containing protein n=1 Tax=Schizopora paradoxa TaxID=27342 RepID=A0A0H2R8Y1_9AGAM|nr:hypothetical protein SCHPADRAFT_931888 [Schizopora paradoxa]
MTRHAAAKAAAKRVLRSLEAAGKLHHGDGQLRFRFWHRNWESGKKIDNLTPDENFDAETMRELASNRCQLEYIVQLTKAIGDSASDLLDRYERFLNPYFAKLSKGFASLPDELLGLIFKFAAHPEEEGPKYSIYISQVSRRFRRIALADQSLWSHLFFRHDTNLRRVKRCIDRAGDHNDVRLILKDSAMVEIEDLRMLMKICSPIAHRLRTISLFGNWDDSWEDANTDYTLAGTLNQLLPRRLSLPRLHELNLAQDFYSNPDNPGGLPIWVTSEAIESTNLWTTPHLRSLRCREYIPPPSFPFKTITSFSLRLTLIIRNAVSDQLVELCDFLSDMPNLEEVDLDLINDGNADEYSGPELEMVPLPAVKSFTIHARKFSLPFGALWVLGSFVNHLHMPKLERLAIHLEWEELNTFFSPRVLNRALPLFVFSMMPNPILHRYLKHCSIELSHPPFNIEDDTSEPTELREKEDLIELKIPLDRIPYVSVLEVKTYGNVYFFLADKDKASMQPYQLRELRLVACNNMVREDLEETLQSLEDIGARDTFERLVISNCELLDESMVDVAMAQKG